MLSEYHASECMIHVQKSFCLTFLFERLTLHVSTLLALQPVWAEFNQPAAGCWPRRSAPQAGRGSLDTARLARRVATGVGLRRRGVDCRRLPASHFDAPTTSGVQFDCFSTAYTLSGTCRGPHAVYRRDFCCQYGEELYRFEFVH